MRVVESSVQIVILGMSARNAHPALWDGRRGDFGNPYALRAGQACYQSKGRGR